MSDGVNVDWGLMKPTDYVGDYANAFQVGRRMTAPSAGNALAPGRPAALPGAPATVEPAAIAPVAGAPPTENPAYDGDLEEGLGALDGPARVRASRQADLLASLGMGLKGVAYPERRAVLAHLAPALVARGVPPQALAGFDPTDETLDAAVAAARAMGAKIAGPS